MLQIEIDSQGRTCLAIKAVPGASRDEVAGLLGDRLKVRISAPPEGGKANKAICKLLARTLGVKPGDIEIVNGASSAEKVVAVTGLDVEVTRERLGLGGL